MKRSVFQGTATDTFQTKVPKAYVSYNDDADILEFSYNKYITEKDADSEYSETLKRIAYAVGSY